MPGSWAPHDDYSRVPDTLFMCSPLAKEGNGRHTLFLGVRPVVSPCCCVAVSSLLQRPTACLQVMKVINRSGESRCDSEIVESQAGDTSPMHVYTRSRARRSSRAEIPCRDTLCSTQTNATVPITAIVLLGRQPRGLDFASPFPVRPAASRRLPCRQRKQGRQNVTVRGWGDERP